MRKFNNILIADDEANILEMLKMVLSESGYNVHTAEDGAKALKILEKENIDVILSDVKMPELTGYELLAITKEKWPNVVFIIFTAFGEIDDVVESMKKGAFDYLLKPITIDLLLMTVQKALKQKELIEEKEELRRENLNYQNNLEQMVKDKTQELEESTIGVLNSLITIVEQKDKYTKGHSLRVAYFSQLIGEKLNLSVSELKILKDAALLHDIGKIGIEDTILNKTGKLTDEEYNLIKQHPQKGVTMLSPIPFCNQLLPIIEYHHERFDGEGYPKRLKDKSIPLFSRIISIVDTFDAMTSDRSYRKGMKIKDAIEEMKRCSGLSWDKTKTRCKESSMQFDPEIMKIFLQVQDKLSDILKNLKHL